MRDNIDALYGEVKEKTEFKKELANVTGYAYRTIDVHWFTGARIIPEAQQEATHSLLINWLKQEKTKREAIIKANI